MSGNPDAIATVPSPAWSPRGPAIAKTIARACRELETMRSSCLARLVKRVGASVVVGVTFAGLIAVGATHPAPAMIGFACGAVMLLLWIYWTRLPREAYREYFRSQFVPAAVRAFGRHTYEPNGTMPRVWTGRSGLLPEHHIYATQDLLSFECGGIAVQYAQAELRRYGTYPTRYGSAQGAAPGLAFGGLLILLSLRKSFAGRTVLDQDRGPLLNLFSEAPADLNIARSGLKVEGGSYEVLATDLEEARRIVDANLVRRLTELIRALGGQRVRVSFYDAQILVMVPLKYDLFRAPSILRRFDGESAGEDLLRKLETIEAIAETLHRRVTTAS